MYQELEIIDALPDRLEKLELLLLFLSEYSGWLQHLQSVGLVWGADGEEVGANKEAAKTSEHIKKIREKIMSLFYQANPKQLTFEF